MLTFMLLALLAAFLRLFECCCSTGLMLLLAAAAVTAFFLELYVLRMTATFSFMLSMYSFFRRALGEQGRFKIFGMDPYLISGIELPPFRVLMSMSTWSRPLTFFARSALDRVSLSWMGAEDIADLKKLVFYPRSLSTALYETIR